MLEMLASQAVSSLAGGLGQAMGGAGPNVSGGTVTSWLDGSGWTVATGNGKARGSVRSDSAMGAAAMDSSQLMWVGLAVLGALALRKWGRSK